MCRESDLLPFRAISRTVSGRMCEPMAHGLLVFVLALVSSVELFACQVPVFRYALERWAADQYQVIVLHDQPLDDAATKALQTLQKAAESTPGRPASLRVKVVEISAANESPTDPRFLELWKADSAEPLMLVYYPKANEVGREEPAFQATLTQKNVATLLDSPLRRKLAEHLAMGDSAVWVFVPCGREKDDQAAYERLEKQLAEDAEWLELPTAEELEVEEKVLGETKVPLRIGFSILKLKRDDLADQFVLQTLLNSEEDLKSFDQPLAFPVFGQGRVLYCLVGKGITSDTIRSASSFMAGPCSCQVKNQNPGFDMLLQADWKKVLGDVLISEPVEKLDRAGLEPTLLTIPPGRKSR